MTDANNCQMAIDLLRVHLHLTEDEAKQQLGLDNTAVNRSISEPHQALIELIDDK
ncbi:hypothetical protein [Vibrio sp. 10N.286.49.B3]|uniref:hypothetical protein n=1 Tax=Vibrio sp. 10N.286.49.B3 TaxID=1880855 RepID=UPI0018E4CC30|nr:hypothetical protein [Vibrio sp. 10N.286.49.B3]